MSPRQPLRVDNILPEDNSSGQKHVRPAPRSRGYQSNGRGYLDVIQRNRIGEWTSLLRPVRGSNIATGIYLDVARSRGDQGEGEGRGGGMQRTCIGRRRRRCEWKRRCRSECVPVRIEVGRHEERPIQCWPLPRVDFPWYIAIEPLSASQCPNERLRGRKIQFSF